MIYRVIVEHRTNIGSVRFTSESFNTDADVAAVVNGVTHIPGLRQVEQFIDGQWVIA